MGEKRTQRVVLSERPGGAFRSLTGLVCSAMRQESRADEAGKGRAHCVLKAKVKYLGFILSKGVLLLVSKMIVFKHEMLIPGAE